MLSIFFHGMATRSNVVEFFQSFNNFYTIENYNLLMKTQLDYHIIKNHRVKRSGYVLCVNP